MDRLSVIKTDRERRSDGGNENKPKKKTNTKNKTNKNKGVRIVFIAEKKRRCSLRSLGKMDRP